MSSETPAILTYFDLIQHASQYDGGRGDRLGEDHYIAAAQMAYREIVDMHDWNCLWTHGRINSVAPYDTGTIAYDHTGGSSERLVTLTSGTFPSWAIYGELRIDSVNYEVESNPSSTTLVLSTRRNPGADVASGTEYTLFRSAYTLPIGFKRMSEPSQETWCGMDYVKPKDWLYREKLAYSSGIPYQFTITSSPDLMGQQVMRFWPVWSEAKTLDFFYQRRAKQIKVTGREAADQQGTVAVSSTAVTGTGTAFDATRHEGCVLRIGSNSTTVPTGMHGRYPPVDERSVSDVVSATSITMDAAGTTASGVKYVLSDQVDLAPYIWSLLFRSVEKHLSLRTKDFEAIKLADWAFKQERPNALESDDQYVATLAGGGGNFRSIVMEALSE